MSQLYDQEETYREYLFREQVAYLHKQLDNEKAEVINLTYQLVLERMKECRCSWCTIKRFFGTLVTPFHQSK